MYGYLKSKYYSSGMEKHIQMVVRKQEDTSVAAISCLAEYLCEPNWKYMIGIADE